MKKSVIIIARNEENYIDRCIQSILNQTQKPDEIILVAHNCTDNTIAIAKKYNIKIIILNEQPRIVYARLSGINYASGDIIFCIDGDSFAQNNWIEKMSKTLEKNILIGSWVKFNGSFLIRFFNLFNEYRCVSKNKKAISWIWGPSFAFWGKDKIFIENILKESEELSKKINLSRNPDDYWLAYHMNKKGNIEVTNKTFVIQNVKEFGWKKELIRTIENFINGWKIKKYLKYNS